MDASKTDLKCIMNNSIKYRACARLFLPFPDTCSDLMLKKQTAWVVQHGWLFFFGFFFFSLFSFHFPSSSSSPPLADPVGKRIEYATKTQTEEKLGDTWLNNHHGALIFKREKGGERAISSEGRLQNARAGLDVIQGGAAATKLGEGKRHNGWGEKCRETEKKGIRALFCCTKHHFQLHQTFLISLSVSSLPFYRQRLNRNKEFAKRDKNRRIRMRKKREICRLPWWWEGDRFQSGIGHYAACWGRWTV